MRYKDLKRSDVTYIKELYWKSTINPVQFPKKKIQETIAKKYEVSDRSVRTWAKNLGLLIEEEQLEGESVQLKKAYTKTVNKKKRRFLVSWAQNATPVNENLFENMKAYAKYIDADIHIIAGRYKNPTSVFIDRNNDSWDASLTPYLDLNRHHVHNYVSILSDIKVQPTATMPLSGLESVTGVDSCIVGHPRMHLKTVPVLEGYPAKILATTGAITEPNYTDSKAGKKGEFHHTLGFVIIEVDTDEIFHIRQVSAKNNGDFIDLDIKVFRQNGETVITTAKECPAVVLGDLHLGVHDDLAFACTIRMLHRLKPKNTVIEDIFDGKSISHHELNNPFLQYEKYQEKKHLVQDEIENMYNWIDKMLNFNLVVVRSNHDDFVDRWLQFQDWKKFPENSLTYINLAKAILEGKAKNGVIPYLINERYGDRVRCLGRNHKFNIKGWELGQHGDIGSGGSRGSLNQLKKLNTKIIVGHYHKPERLDGAMSVGTLTKLRLGYNDGPSSWLQGNIIVNEYGKAQHVNIINGRYTTLYD